MCVSYPKSGRTWLRAMLAGLGVDARFTHFGDAPGAGAWGLHARHVRAPVVDEPRIVFLHRDPRDVVVSFYHHLHKRRRPSLARQVRWRVSGTRPPPELGRFVRSPRFGLEKVIAYNLATAQLAALPVAYEAMSERTADTLAEVAGHFGAHPAPQEVARVVAEHEFAVMQARERAGVAGESWLRAKEPGDPSSYKVRRGKVGGWRDELDAATQDWADEVLRRTEYAGRMADLGAPTALAGRGS
ncbi:sulfotransferase domain-containing protein [Acuticoccus sp.]|uniref:sulfotransferase domain-containing protein n=1 Tax=Acuticoccus sp. TaxID=1904378 RepID=UPI003B52E991